MLYLLLLSLVVLSLATTVTADKYLYLDNPDGAPVIDHTDENQFQSSNALKVVEFYSPYCGYVVVASGALYRSTNR